MRSKVLYSFPGRIGTAGVGTTAWYQVTELIKLGVGVTLFCGSCERPIDGAERIVETMRVARVPLPYRLLGNDYSYRFHDEKVAHHLRTQKGRYDAVHTWPLGALRTLRAARAIGLPGFLERPNTHTAHAFKVVAEEHARLKLPVPRDNPHAFHQGRLNRELLEYEAADFLLCPSDVVAQTFLDRGFSVERIARHQYGYDPVLFRPHDQRAGGNEVGRGFTAVFIGRCEPRKGLHYALQAWFNSGACEIGRFIICGSFITGYRELLAPYLEHSSIECRGFSQDIPGIMQSADVLLLPALEEGSALVTYEARGSGCVLLVSDATGAPCVHGHNALVHEARDLGKLSSDLKLLFNSSGQLSELRKNSLSDLVSLTWARAGLVLRSAYDEINSR